MRIIQAFKLALINMLERGELEKVLNYADEQDKPRVEHDIMVIEEFAKVGADEVSIWPLLMSLESSDIFKNALAFMITCESDDKIEIDEE